eukprot:2929328-Prymnesium_polylepis.2
MFGRQLRHRRPQMGRWVAASCPPGTNGGGTLHPAYATCTRSHRCPTTGRHSPLLHAQLRAVPQDRSQRFAIWLQIVLVRVREVLRRAIKVPNPTSTRCGWAGRGGHRSGVGYRQP